MAMKQLQFLVLIEVDTNDDDPDWVPSSEGTELIETMIEFACHQVAEAGGEEILRARIVSAAVTFETTTE